MRGTSVAPDAHIKLKVGSRPGFVELDINRGKITGLKPASQFGQRFSHLCLVGGFGGWKSREPGRDYFP